MLIDHLIKYGLTLAGDLTLTDLRVGVHYTGALLENGACGLAFTFSSELRCHQDVKNGISSWIGRPVRELLPKAASSDLLESVGGVAVLNALVNQLPLLRKLPGFSEGKSLDPLGLDSSDSVGMVGCFAPLVQQIRSRVKELRIIERQAIAGEETYPDWTAAQILPQCDVVIITGTTVINKTIDQLLEYSKNARTVAILGPSTPMVPEVFWPHGVTILEGSVVTDGPEVFRIIGQGGGMRNCRRALQPVGFLRS